jgi:hypothetical protein
MDGCFEQNVIIAGAAATLAKPATGRVLREAIRRLLSEDATPVSRSIPALGDSQERPAWFTATVG